MPSDLSLLLLEDIPRQSYRFMIMPVSATKVADLAIIVVNNVEYDYKSLLPVMRMDLL